MGEVALVDALPLRTAKSSMMAAMGMVNGARTANRGEAGKRGSRRSRGSLSGDGEAASGSSGGDSASEGASEYEVDEHGNRVRRRKHRSSSRRSEADGEAGLAADGEGGVDGTMGLGDDGKGGQTLSRREREKLKLKESAHFTYNFVPPHLQDADWERGLFPPSDAMVLGNGALVGQDVGARRDAVDTRSVVCVATRECRRVLTRERPFSVFSAGEVNQDLPRSQHLCAVAGSHHPRRFPWKAARASRPTRPSG